jgi:hypothetical protein
LSATLRAFGLHFQVFDVPLLGDRPQNNFLVCEVLAPVWDCLGVHFPCANARF